jgi:hypothetical protein
MMPKGNTKESKTAAEAKQSIPKKFKSLVNIHLPISFLKIGCGGSFSNTVISFGQ